MREENHLRALGILVGVDQELLYLTTTLRLMARTPAGIRLGAPESTKRKADV